MRTKCEHELLIIHVMTKSVLTSFSFYLTLSIALCKSLIAFGSMARKDGVDMGGGYFLNANSLSLSADLLLFFLPQPLLAPDGQF